MKIRVKWRRLQSRWRQCVASLFGLRRFEQWAANDDFLMDQWWGAYNAGDLENAEKIRRQMNKCREKYLQA